jgi:hypothetical protein
MQNAYELARRLLHKKALSAGAEKAFSVIK